MSAGGRWQLVALALVASCGGPSAPGSTTAVDDDPMTVGENQQGHPEVVTAPSLPVTSSPLPDTYVWCENSSGMACLRVSAALGGISIKNPANAPPALTLLEDLPDDCVATGMAEIRRRVDGAIATAPSSWRDQGGDHLDTGQFSSMYAAAGCITDAGSPVVKIGVSASVPRLYLVRVWESGSGY